MDDGLLSRLPQQGVGTGPATARPKFPEPTIKNIPLFVIKQLDNFILQLSVYATLIKELHYYIERTS